jgi:protein-S-isoprenylcysteine O-methyltransferase Ste14
MKSVSILVLLNFAAIGVLPRIFFRRGRFNARWIITAAPYAISSVAVLLATAGLVDPWIPSGRSALDAAAVVASATSLSLIWLTVGTHRIPLALWHQNDDPPHEIVTWGPYASIRHPFYSSFLLALLAGVLVAPSPGTVAMLIVGATLMSITARREERRLLSSPLGAGYRDYMRSTGRFLPVVGRLS